MTFETEIKAVFFDLDGTLLPMDQDYFIKKYFKAYAKYASELGLDAKSLVEGTLTGIGAMIGNNGERSNEEAFWDAYFSTVGECDRALLKKMDNFYFDEFKYLKDYTDENPFAVDMINAAKKGGRKVILATNPVFPMVAQLERISWLGLKKSDFDYITSYENSHFCKPNPKYYLEICEKMGLSPENCIMFGNDESDDMKGAAAAGLKCFLITDCRIISNNFVWTGERGSFEQALKLVERL